ncbi:hypothetical protein D5S17_30260 [Pseudonocardiaceae bacterium YIM PH 21723]|nr:hypothetical protein D5S17_30260 [Pseudonocardiaceae bacterium YIM PH 21723]
MSRPHAGSNIHVNQPRPNQPQVNQPQRSQRPAPNQGGGAPMGGGTGFHADPDGIDNMGRNLGTTRDGIARAGQSIGGVQVGPKSFGELGYVFAGKVNEVVNNATQHVGKMSESIGHASENTKHTANNYRTVDDHSQQSFRSVAQGSAPPAPWGGGTGPGPARGGAGGPAVRPVPEVQAGQPGTRPARMEAASAAPALPKVDPSAAATVRIPRKTITDAAAAVAGPSGFGGPGGGQRPTGFQPQSGTSAPRPAPGGFGPQQGGQAPRNFGPQGAQASATPNVGGQPTRPSAPAAEHGRQGPPPVRMTEPAYRQAMADKMRLMPMLEPGKESKWPQLAAAQLEEEGKLPPHPGTPANAHGKPLYEQPGKPETHQAPAPARPAAGAPAKAVHTPEPEQPKPAHHEPVPEKTASLSEKLGGDSPPPVHPDEPKHTGLPEQDSFDAQKETKAQAEFDRLMAEHPDRHPDQHWWDARMQVEMEGLRNQYGPDFPLHMQLEDAEANLRKLGFEPPEGGSTHPGSPADAGPDHKAPISEQQQWDDKVQQRMDELRPSRTHDDEARLRQVAIDDLAYEGHHPPAHTGHPDTPAHPDHPEPHHSLDEFRQEFHDRSWEDPHFRATDEQLARYLGDPTTPEANLRRSDLQDQVRDDLNKIHEELPQKRAELARAEDDFARREADRLRDEIEEMEAKEPLLRRQEAQLAHMGDAHVVAVRDYALTGYTSTNGALRSDIGDGLEERTPHVQALSSALDTMPDHSGQVYRGMHINDPEKLAAFIEQYQPKGDGPHIVRDPSFVSSSRDPKVAFDGAFTGNVKMTIESSHGKDLQLVPQRNEREAEILFQAGTNFRIDKFDIDADGNISVHMTDLGRGDV